MSGCLRFGRTGAGAIRSGIFSPIGLVGFPDQLVADTGILEDGFSNVFDQWFI